HVAGRWVGREPAQPLAHAVTDETVAHTHREPVDFGDALAHARGPGLAGLLALDFQRRAAILRALGKWLAERKERLYEVSAWTGAGRKDSWVDIDGGIGTLFAYASIGAQELPSGNLVHEGP